MSDIFTEIGQVVLTSLLSLVAMFIFTRAGGKRQIAQMSPFDYLNAVTVGSIGAELATNLEQWWRPFSALVVYGLVTWFVHYTACKSNAMRSLWSGRSLILMDDGVILKSSLQRAAIDVNEFLGQARVAGYFDPNEIETAILETNGQISFLPKSCSRPLTPDDMQLHPDAASTWYDLIIDGHLMQDNLKAAGRDERWLNARLHAQQKLALFIAAKAQVAIHTGSIEDMPTVGHGTGGKAGSGALNRYRDTLGMERFQNGTDLVFRCRKRDARCFARCTRFIAAILFELIGEGFNGCRHANSPFS